MAGKSVSGTGRLTERGTPSSNSYLTREEKSRFVLNWARKTRYTPALKIALVSPHQVLWDLDYTLGSFVFVFLS